MITAREIKAGQLIRTSDHRVFRAREDAQPARSLGGREQVQVPSHDAGLWTLFADQKVELAREFTETRLLFDLADMSPVGRSVEDAEAYIEGSVRVHGEHVRARFQIQQRPVVTFEGEWVTL